MDWDRVRLEAKGCSQGVEWVRGKGYFRQWITQSIADADEPLSDELPALSPSIPEQLLKELAEDWPKWNSPLED
jgi:hypothetical protein